MRMTKKHHVDFWAHRPVKEEVQVAFTKSDGTPVSFKAHEKVMESVEIRFMARNQ